MKQGTRSVEINGQSARLLVAGDGAPVVLLHGWGGRIESMAPVASCLADGHLTIALDLPGFGESPAPVGVWGTPDYAAFVRDLLVDEGIGRASFVGHSFGAKTSLYLAATYPDMVDKLVLVGATGLKQAPSMRARAKRIVSRSARAVGVLGPPGRALKGVVYRRIASQDYRDAGALRPILVKVVNEDLSGLMPRVQSPTLLVWGSEDDATPLSHAKRMERLIPDAGLVTFEGAGHFAYLDEAARFCRVIRHFLGTG